MKRIDFVAATTFALLGILVAMPACSSDNKAGATKGAATETIPTCKNGMRDGDETGPDCGGSCATRCAPDGSNPQTGQKPEQVNGEKDRNETDVDCGGESGVKCAEGKSCLADSDCDGFCNYANKCVSAPSCKTHLGGDTCGLGEVGSEDAKHESCCRTLEVTGYTDPGHPGKKVYVDKYEITAGRIRAFIQQIATQYNGDPNIRAWIEAHRPEIWEDAWNEFLPTDWEGGTKVIARRLLGDPRVEDGEGGNGPGVILPPDTDQVRRMGVNYQFGPEIYVDLHGNNCGTHEDTWGWPTYWYPTDILVRDGQLTRADGVGYSGEAIAAKDLLDVKSMNCITNAMLAAFCAWDGGQLVTDEVLDYITATPATLGNVSGCGTQYDDHGNLLGNDYTDTLQTGGRCPPVIQINATFDAGDTLPVEGSPLNTHNYHYPDLGLVTHDKAWQVGAPGRASLAPEANNLATDMLRINPEDEPWMDLAGNLNEAAFDMSGATFTGKFALKYRGLAYGSSRSDLNVKPVRGEDILRIQRPEAKAAYIGGRCMRFR